MRTSKKMLHTDQALEASKSMIHPRIWRLGALASAVILLGSLASTNAHALALGRATVQSALGEALRAEIDIAEINAEEAGSLRVGVASSDAFKAAGLEYSATAIAVQVSLQKRPDGRSFLRLSSPRAVTEPFVDLMIEANWSSGRVVRDYTLLFDPPNLRQATSPITAPRISSAPGASTASSGTSGRTPDVRSSTTPAQTVRPVPMARATRPAAIEPQKQLSSGQQVVVKPGDTASKIAGQSKPVGISLDQMLVALLSSNPDAFIGGNVNRLKAGAVLEIPSEQTAGATAAAQASQTIVAQSKNFNNFRRKLAEGAPAAQIAGADRKADGKLQAKVDDTVSGSKPPDKLTLSKGAVQSKALAEEKIAKDRQAISESTRIAELSKNITDLDKLKGIPAGPAGAVTGATGAASAAKGVGVAIQPPAVLPASPALKPASAAASAPILTASASRSAASTPAASPPVVAAPVTVASASTTPMTTATTAIAGTSTTVAAGTTVTAAAVSPPEPAASAVAAVAALPASAVASGAAAPASAVRKMAAAPPPAAQASLVDDLIGNEFTLPALAALLALLGGFVFYKNRKKNNPAAVDSSFLESRLQPDSFFGASGGQRVDTSESSSASGSSLVYSPSQLDAAGDVDPVAEADVYLAYGRDLQAEEILKEALRTTPARVAIHAKLAEIYSKRRDIKGFEAISTEAFAITSGNGPEWSYITELGRELDPANNLYKPGGQPVPVQSAAAAKSAALAGAFGSDTIPVPHLVSANNAAVTPDNLDFDLDLDVLSESVPDAPAATAALAKTEPGPAFDSGAMDFNDLRLSTQPMPIKAGAVSASDIDYSSTQPVVAIRAPASSPTPAPPAVMDSGMLEFDLNSLSLDLENSSRPTAFASQPVAVPSEGPLETKFALAEEFRALGDADGARSLANEVMANAQGALKTKAQAFLNSLM